MRYEIVFSGSGGQGMLLSGLIAAEASALKDHYYAVQSQTYGPEARGGLTESYVIISKDKPIHYPKVTKPRAIVALSQAGLDRYLNYIDENTLVVVDASLDLSQVKKGKCIAIPCATISQEVMGREISANIAALGAFAAASQMISSNSLKEIIASRVPSHTIDKNIEVFEKGYHMAIKLV